MATLDELSTALRNADAAGDADAARAFAAEITKMRSQPVAKGSILPLSRDAGGNVSFDSDAGIVGSLKRAFTLPGEVMKGEASPNDVGRVMELATAATPVNPAIRAGDAIIPGASRALATKKPVVPTTKELYDEGVKDLNAAADSGLEIAAPAIVDWSRRAQQSLYDNGGITEVNAPQTFALLKKFEDAPPGAVASAKNLKSIREALGGVAQNFNPQAAKDQLAASRVIAGLDEFVPNVDASAVLAGSPAATSKLLERGRGNYAASQRSNDITGDLDKAVTGLLERTENRAQASYSGRNMDNSIRQRVASALERPKEISGLSDAEIAALQGVVEGGAGRNTARYIGNLLGGGGGVGQSVMAAGGAGGGFLAGGPIGAVAGAALPAITGAGAKSVANALARRDIKGVDELLRKRSPLYQERVANPEKYVRSPEGRAAIVKALMEAQFGQD